MLKNITFEIATYPLRIEPRAKHTTARDRFHAEAIRQYGPAAASDDLQKIEEDMVTEMAGALVGKEINGENLAVAAQIASKYQPRIDAAMKGEKLAVAGDGYPCDFGAGE